MLPSGAPPTFGLWSETLPYAELRAPRVLALLQRYALDLALAVRPGDLGELARTVRVCADGGVRVTLWPMIEDREGRWANARNVDAFGAFVRSVLAALPEEGAFGLAVDLEPAIDDGRALLEGFAGAGRVLRSSLLGARRYDAARDKYVGLVREARARGLSALCAALPVVLLDPAGARPRWQKLLGTPVDGPPFDRVSVMLYTSLLEGWSRGVFKRDDARAVLAAGCRATVARFGVKAGVSLGTVGTGAFGDEPTYRSPAELADDVALARGAGVGDLMLFDLGGVLRRGPSEAWLETLVGTPAAQGAAPETARARAAFSIGAVTAGSLRAVAPLLGWALRRVKP